MWIEFYRQPRFSKRTGIHVEFNRPYKVVNIEDYYGEEYYTIRVSGSDVMVNNRDLAENGKDITAIIRDNKINEVLK